jgi:hypothetical protein
MSREIQQRPLAIELDDGLGDRLTPFADTPPASSRQPFSYGAGRESPYADYVRILTPEGGILIMYRDLRRGWPINCLRLAAWLILMGAAYWIIQQLELTEDQRWYALATAAALNLFLVTRKIKRRHSVEIRHDRMILDGKDVFWRDDFGGELPQLYSKGEDDHNRMVIAGICGSRLIQLMTANRLSKHDMTPEVLARDLENA